VSKIVLFAIVVLQSLGAVFFAGDILSSYIGIGTHPLSWRLREMLEIAAVVGLFLGVGMGWLAFRALSRRSYQAEQKLRLASGAFMELLSEKFDAWGLTAAERDVALFALKGMSLSEIAGLRQTSEGTVKAQTNAIYRKAGVSGRPQLLSLFIEDLLGEGLIKPTGAAGA
jgi:DNA-binding CsgD family transcriptional regulator